VKLPASRCARGSLSAASALEPASFPCLLLSTVTSAPFLDTAQAHFRISLRVNAVRAPSASRASLGDHLLEVRLGYGRRAVGAGAMPEPDLEEEVVKDVRTKCFFDISHGLQGVFRILGLGLGFRV